MTVSFNILQVFDVSCFNLGGSIEPPKHPPPPPRSAPAYSVAISEPKLSPYKNHWAQPNMQL